MFKTNLTHSQAVILAEKLEKKFAIEEWVTKFNADDSVIYTDSPPPEPGEIELYIEAFEEGVKTLEPTLDEIQEYANQITSKINQI